MAGKIRIGTRDSQLAVWQATWVKDMLLRNDIESELVYIKSEGDLDTITPLYALGVQGVFTKTLDAALLNQRIDIAVHSMKDVPIQLAEGIRQAAVLKRASHKDIFVPHPDLKNPEAVLAMEQLLLTDVELTSGAIEKKQILNASGIGKGKPKNAIIATSSIRRIAQWKRFYPHHQIVDIRGNVNTRLSKLKESDWSGAIFAAAGLERIGLRPENAIDLNWMLPAPAQGAVVVLCREDDDESLISCKHLNDHDTALCTKIEKDFLKELMGGCSTPISALAVIEDGVLNFKGQICSPGGEAVKEISSTDSVEKSEYVGITTAKKLLSESNVQEMMKRIRNGR